MEVGTGLCGKNRAFFVVKVLIFCYLAVFLTLTKVVVAEVSLKSGPTFVKANLFYLKQLYLKMSLRYTLPALRFGTLPWRLLAALFLFLTWGQQVAWASHAMGADIRYECLGNGQYRVTMSYYRDCAGISAPTTASLAISSASCNLTLPNVTMQRDLANSNIEVSQLCPSSLPQSRCNGGTLPGVQLFTYTAVITLPQECSDWRISYTECCRNDAITNLVSPASQNIHINARINNVGGLCNSSPRFSTLPVPYVCAGQPFSFNHGAIDADGDSLVYVLISPLTTLTGPIAHVPGRSATQPMNTTPANGFVFNPNSGQMDFTPQGAQIAVVAVRVFEIRNGDTIGDIMRDVQVVVINNCANQNIQPATNPTVLTGGSYDAASRSFFVCAGTRLDFSIGASDPDGDSILINQANTNFAQVFGAGNVLLTPFYPVPGRVDTILIFGSIFNIQPGAYTFTIGLRDNACPVPGNQTLAFNLAVPGIDVQARDTTICPGVAQTVPFTSRLFTTGNVAAPGEFTWTQISGPVASLSSDTVRNPILSVPSTTLPGQDIVYTVQFTTFPDPTTGASCVTRDTVTVALRNLPLNVNVTTLDTTLCQNGLPNTINLSSTVSGPGVDSTNGTYIWTTVPAGRVGTLNSTSIPSPVAQAAGAPSDTISYRLRFQYGTCFGEDDVTVRFRNGRVNITPPSPTICAGDTVQLLASLTDTFRIPTNQGCNDYDVQPTTFQTFPTTGATTVTLGDEQITAALPIGFNFPFYCDNYSQFIISSNGFISFTLNSPNGCCSGQTLPTAATPNNLIALNWADLNPSNGGTISYVTQGTAPNRRLVVTFNGVFYFGGTAANTTTGQIVLYEADGAIEIHSGNIGPRGSGSATQGLENQNGTVGHPVPNRNATLNGFSAVNSAFRFTRVPSFIALGTSQQWTPNIAITNDTLANPRVFPNTTTTYVVTITEGNCPMSDSVVVTVASTLPPPTIACGAPSDPARTVLFTWGQVPGAASWEYSLDSGRTWVARALADSSFLLTNLIPGDCRTIYVRAVGGVGPCSRNAAAVFTCCTSPCNTTLTNISTANVLCHGDSSGVIRVLAAGGSLGPPYRYTVINADNGLAVSPVLRANDTLVAFVPIGSFYLFVQDSFGCPGTTDTFTISQPSPLVAILDSTQLTRCFNTSDGNAFASASGGAGSYAFSWSAGQTGSNASGLAVGTYAFTVTDSNGCQASVNNVEIRAPFSQAPEVTTSVTNSAACPGNGAIQIIAVQNMTGNPTPGGSGSLTYLWSTGATNVTQLLNINSGIYGLTVTDVNGCSFNRSIVVEGANVSITAPTLSNPDCGLNNGAITVNATGSPSYNYLWSDGQLTQTATGLAGGQTYVVTVTGSNGCTASASYSLAANTLAINVASIQERVCAGEATGFINLSANATLAPSFIWSNGATTANVSGLAAGVYTVTATTQNGGITCSATLTATIREPQPFVLAVSLTRPLDCSGLADAQGNVVASGGWGDYAFVWSNGNTASDINNLPAGTYGVTATDAQGCVSQDSLVVPAVLIPQLAAWINNQGRERDTVPVGVTVGLSAGADQTAQGVSYQWIPTTGIAAPTAATTTYLASTEGDFSFVVVATAGNCSATDTVFLTVSEVGLRGMPTAFTPNGDGSNDFFRPAQANNLNVAEFRIFNRWGQVVYNNPNDYQTGWDGTFNGQMQPADVYMYVFVYSLPGQTEQIVLKGEITLIR